MDSTKASDLCSLKEVVGVGELLETFQPLAAAGRRPPSEAAFSVQTKGESFK